MRGCNKGVKATKTTDIVFNLVSIAHQTGKHPHIYVPSVAGFELVLARKMTFYVITYYLPSGLFVVVSWISFLVNPECIPGGIPLEKTQV